MLQKHFPHTVSFKSYKKHLVSMYFVGEKNEMIIRNTPKVNTT